MSHEAQHSTTAQQQPSTSFNSALWFVVVLTLLFICAVNFVGVMSGSHEEKTATTETTTSPESGSGH